MSGPEAVTFLSYHCRPLCVSLSRPFYFRSLAPSLTLSLPYPPSLLPASLPPHFLAVALALFFHPLHSPFPSPSFAGRDNFSLSFPACLSFPSFHFLSVSHSPFPLVRFSLSLAFPLVSALPLSFALSLLSFASGEDYRDPGLEGLVREELPGWYLQTLPELMGRALAIPTVSSAPGDYDTEQLLRFHAFLRESFPNAFNASFVEVEVVNNYSFLFTVKGSDPALQPYLLAAHMDVVPVDVSKWTQDPWSGQVIPDPETGEDYVWGRGAIDDKLGVMGIMAALDYLVTSGFQPTRSFYVAFGHDEEVHGEDGAGHIGALLQERGVALDFVLDEGMPVLDGVMAGMEIPVAAIGVTEKGWMRVRLEADGEGGHSSIPPHDQAVTRLASALVNLQRYPQPSMFGEGTEADLLTLMAHKASWPHKLVYANTWLFEPLLKVIMSRSRETNAIIRTTTAATIVRAGVKVSGCY
ncbi:putative carboxypeptidase PM20D1.2-like [Penaeus vannamei]|uniref:Putative carboxypeptidase PM20D1.2-like n=1 Tax=Penaeus vannamei TaxID=6689 RepID=A0A3R7PEL8_PENVA|nr:putative carboxypeptidase PM20D1.2-like [Penaeus vannamei]